MDFNLKVKAIKDGKMDEGEFFCYKDKTYRATIIKDAYADDDFDDNDAYHVEDELNLTEFPLDYEKYGFAHEMPEDFFKEYFEIIEKIS